MTWHGRRFGRPRRGRAVRSRRDFLAALLFLAPNFVGFVAFIAVPVVVSLVMALTNWDLARREPFGFVGFGHFASLLWGERSGEFWKYLLNTVYFMMGMPISVAGSLLLAVLLSKPIRITGDDRGRHVAMAACVAIAGAVAVVLWWSGRRDAAFWMGLFTAAAVGGGYLGTVWFRTLFYLPHVTAGVAMFILWKNLYSTDFVLTRNILLSMNNLWGMDPERITPAWAFFGLGARDAIIFMGVWTAIGGANMLLYLAALRTIPAELYDAATVDGAGPWATFRHVTWPLLAPTTFLVVVISMIAGVQGGFEQARVMTEGGPAGTTVTLGYYVYLMGFEEFRLGLASAICWVMFAMVFAVTVANWRFGGRGETV